MLNKVLISIFCLVAIFCALPAQAGPVSPQGLELTSFTLQVPPQAKLGDKVVISFSLKNVGQQPVIFSPKFGIFVGARAVLQDGKKLNRDFGAHYHGLTLKPGQSVTHQAQQVLDMPGQWWFWPAYAAMDDWGPFDSQKKVLKVEAAKPTLASNPAFGSGHGRSLVLWKGKKLFVQLFPEDNPWNQDISKLPVHPNSDQLVRNIGAYTNLHPDFGSGRDWKVVGKSSQKRMGYGIPYMVVRAGQKKLPVSFHYKDESDPGPYPIPLDAPIEGGPNGKGDRHVIVLDYDNLKLYELFNAQHDQNGGWKAGSGAVFDLTTNKLRPKGWTSADAAGLPILPGLVRYEEVAYLGEIRHALRFTAEKTERSFIPPATHWGSTVRSDARPCMGMRFRLKASFDITPFPEPVKVILRALKKYGMFLADNGGNWFISGAPHPDWDNDAIEWLKKIKGKEFEVVYTGERQSY